MSLKAIKSEIAAVREDIRSALVNGHYKLVRALRVQLGHLRILQAQKMVSALKGY